MENTRPKVSICIPAYKQVEFLKKALDSILIQSYQNYEIIVTDDSPDDGVKHLVETYDFQNKLKYFKNNISLGSPENWNKAVEIASGEYIKMLHHDDFFTFPYSLQSYVELLERNPHVDFAFSAAIAMNLTENKTWLHLPTKEQLSKLENNPLHLFFGNYVGPPSSTIYRNNKDLKYDKNLKWVVDFDFYIQCLLKNKAYAFSNEPLITSISGALHNITNECINSKEVEIFEYLYLLKKISEENLFVKKDYIVFFKNLFSKYKISSIKEIREAGFEGPLPLFIKLLVYKRSIKYVFKKK